MRNEDELDPQIGEVYEPWPRYSDRTQPAGLTGDHVCGTEEEWQGRAAWPYTGPPVEYDDQNIPLCCGRGRDAQVTAGASPASVVQLLGPQLGYATAAASPASVYRLAVSYTGHVTAGASPASVVQLLGPQLGQVEAGASPASVVQLLGPQLGQVEAGASLASVVELIPGDHDGHDCPAAIPLTLGVTRNEPVLNAAYKWFVFTVPDGAEYLLSVSNSGPSSMSHIAWIGNGCADLGLQFMEHYGNAVSAPFVGNPPPLMILKCGPAEADTTLSVLVTLFP